MLSRKNKRYILLFVILLFNCSWLFSQSDYFINFWKSKDSSLAFTKTSNTSKFLDYKIDTISKSPFIIYTESESVFYAVIGGYLNQGDFQFIIQDKTTFALFITQPSLHNPYKIGDIYKNLYECFIVKQDTSYLNFTFPINKQVKKKSFVVFKNKNNSCCSGTSYGKTNIIAKDLFPDELSKKTLSILKKIYRKYYKHSVCIESCNCNNAFLNKLF